MTEQGVKMEQTKTMVLTDEMGKTVLMVRMEYCDRQAVVRKRLCLQLS